MQNFQSKVTLKEDLVRSTDGTNFYLIMLPVILSARNPHLLRSETGGELNLTKNQWGQAMG